MTTCAKSAVGRYLIRNDGTVIEMETTAQTPVVEDATGQLLANVTSVEDGPAHGCAATAAGAVECWQTVASGGNGVGQLGNGTITSPTTTFRATPVLTAPATPLTNVVSVAAGDTLSTNASCAVTSDGHLYCWGNLQWIANGGAALVSPYAQPITKEGITPFGGVLQVSVAGDYACAIVQGSATNEAWCWGAGGTRNLGQGDTTNHQFPVKVMGLTNPTRIVTSNYTNLGSVSVGTATTCALDVGNVRCWGSTRAAGEGGPGDTSGATVANPSLVVIQDGTTVLPGILDLEGGIGASCGLRMGGTLWCWGAVATNYGATNVVSVGTADTSDLNIQPRFLTSDGVYHVAMTPVTVKCTP